MCNVAGQEMPAADIGPGDVDELLHDHGGVIFTDHLRCQVEMVIMQHDNSGALLTFDFYIYGIGDSAVSDTVAICPGILYSAGERGILVGIVKVVL